MPVDMEARKRLFSKIRSDRYRARLEAMGMCTTGCGQPARSGHVECETCLEKRRTRSRRTWPATRARHQDARRRRLGLSGPGATRAGSNDGRRT